ncbi:MAG TPA: hypothetical protein VGC90_07485, partial [Candidatus Limnocylindrales bacterium]
RSVSPATLAPLAIGLLALVVGTAFGWDARLVDAIVAPPPLIRAALAGLAAAVGVALLAASLRRLGAEHDRIAGEPPDMPTMVRGIRLAFLAVAAFAAAVGWVVGNPLPIVIALVIAGVDVIETSFLLLVVTVRRG